MLVCKSSSRKIILPTASVSILILIDVKKIITLLQPDLSGVNQLDVSK